MALLTETSAWVAGIYEWATTDPVLGGPPALDANFQPTSTAGIDNAPTTQLANRTLYLRDRMLQGLGAGALKKNTLVQYGRTSAGVPNFVTFGAPSGGLVQMTISCSVIAMAATFSAGYSANGPALNFGFRNTNFVTNISTSLHLLFAEYDGTGGINFVTESYPGTGFAYGVQYGAPSSPNIGSCYYELQNDIMYRYDGIVWLPVARVFIGFIDATGGALIMYNDALGRGVDYIFTDSTPPGTVQAYGPAIPASGPPPGYLLCDGSAVSRSIYGRLFAALGTAYGAGDGSTTFNLPDLRGEFIRGLDAGRGVDTGRVIGTSQVASVAPLSMTVNGNTTVFDSTNAPPDNTTGAKLGAASLIGPGSANVTTISYTFNSGGTETRPRNVAMNYIIRF